jgi:uncharacterized repeat protein (TIGR02543 family)
VVDYQSALGDLPTPVKSGSYFLGWYMDAEFTTLADENIIVTDDFTVYAKWNAFPILPSNIHITPSAESCNYMYVGDDIYFSNNETMYYDFSLIDFPEIDSNVMNVFGSNPEYKTLVFGTNTLAPEAINIQSTGISFNLFLSNGLVRFSIGNIVLYLPTNTEGFYIYLQKGVEVRVINTLTFNTNGGTSINPITTYSGEIISSPSLPTKSEMIFAGWYTNTGLTAPFSFTNNPINEDMTLYAKWTPIVDNSVPDPVDDLDDSDTSVEVIEFLKDYWVVVLVFLLGIAVLTGKKR